MTLAHFMLVFNLYAHQYPMRYYSHLASIYLLSLTYYILDKLSWIYIMYSYPKILFSDNSLWGLLNFRRGIIRHFLSKNYLVVLVAPMDTESKGLTVPDGAKYISVAMCRAGTNPISDFQYYRQIKMIYAEERPDYIFHYTIKPNIYGSLAARSLNIPSSAMIAGLGFAFTEKNLPAFLARRMCKYALRTAEHVFVLNKGNYELLIRLGIVAASKLIWLRGGEGVDLEKFRYAFLPENEKPRFLMMSRLLYDKGYSEFVQAARSLKGRADFIVMGAVDPRPTAVPLDIIHRDVADQTIKYIPFSPDVRQEIAEADCVVLPSYYGEGLSRVLMEACAVGRPLITTDIDGCRECVKENVNGYIIPPKDSSALTSACLRFLGLTQDERLQMGRASRKKAELIFDERKVIHVYEALIVKSD